MPGELFVVRGKTYIPVSRVFAVFSDLMPRKSPCHGAHSRPNTSSRMAAAYDTGERRYAERTNELFDRCRDDKTSVILQQRIIAEAAEPIHNKWIANLNENRLHGRAIHHSQVIVELLKKGREPDCATNYGNMCVSFGGDNNGVQAGLYDGSKGDFIFMSRWPRNKTSKVLTVSVASYDCGYNPLSKRIKAVYSRKPNEPRVMYFHIH